MRITGSYFCSALSTRISSEWWSQSPQWWCWRPVAGSRSSASCTITVLKGARRSVTNRPKSVLLSMCPIRGRMDWALLFLKGNQVPLLGEGPQKHVKRSESLLLSPSYVHIHTLNPRLSSHSALLEWLTHSLICPLLYDFLLFYWEYLVNKIYQKAPETRKLKAHDKRNKRLREFVPQSFPHTINKNTLFPVRSEA